MPGPDPAGIRRGRVRAGSCGDNHVSSRVERFGGGRGQCRGRQSASLSAEPGRGLAVAFPLPAPALGWPGLLGRTPFSFPLPLCRQLPASAAKICEKIGLIKRFLTPGALLRAVPFVALLHVHFREPGAGRGRCFCSCSQRARFTGLWFSQ